MSQSPLRRRVILFAFLSLVITGVVVTAGLTSREASAEADRASGDGSRPRVGAIRAVFGGDEAAAFALRTGVARGRSITSVDLDQDGAPDVVAGYGNNRTGIITIQRGNTDAYAPTDESVYARIQAGYNPDPLVPETQTFAVPTAVDFIGVADADHDGLKDIVFASRGGGLYFLKRGQGMVFGEATEVPLPGPVTAMAVGEFRAADGQADIAVGVTGGDGPQILAFDGALGALQAEPQRFATAAAPTTILIGTLDGDGFGDIAAAAGDRVDVIHGWGRKVAVDPAGQVEQIGLASGAADIAAGDFVWDREARREIAVLSGDGTVNLLQAEGLSTERYSASEMATRKRGSVGQVRTGSRDVDVEKTAGWAPSQAGWQTARTLFANAIASNTGSRPLLMTSNMDLLENDDLTVGSGSGMTVYRQVDASNKDRGAFGRSAVSIANDMAEFTLTGDISSAVGLQMPPKLNGERDMVVLRDDGGPAMLVPEVNETITVDRTDDPSGASLAAASVCSGGASDCSLRGAFEFANNSSGVTINLPAGTYILSTNGTSAVGCDANSGGDLLTNKSTTLSGAGAGTTIIRQTGTGPSNDGDRVMCMNTAFTPNLTWTFSGVTMVGGREGASGGGGSAIGGGGIIGGELNNSLTLSGVVMANNQETVTGSANLGGGALQITGGNLIITNSTFGGTNVPNAYTDRSSTNTGNTQAGSGGGITYTPSSPQHTGGTGTLTVTGSTFSHNTANGLGGGGVDALIFAFAMPGGIGSGSASISTSTVSNNSATAGNGAGVFVESLPTTLATSTVSNNAAAFNGGGSYVAGGSLTLNGATPTITFSGNTAGSTGSGIGVNVGIDQQANAPPQPGDGTRTINPTGGVQLQGTNTVLTGQDVFIAFNGAWTNQAGSSLSFGNLTQDSGGNSCGGCLNLLEAAFKVNNTTTNISGNWTMNGATFVGDSGTVNVAGNFGYTIAAGAGDFQAGTSTVNFNGTGAQSISNGASITFNNLTDSNTAQPLVANNNFAVGGNLNVNGSNAIFDPVAGAVISGSGTLTGTGTARVRRIAATPDLLSQYTITNKTLTNLTVEYDGSAAQTVSAVSYGGLKINNGSGVTLASGTTAVNGQLTLTSGTLAVSTNTLTLFGGHSIGSGSLTSSPTGTVNYNQTSGGQSVIAANYGILSFSNFNKVLPAATVGIAGSFTPGTATGHTITGNTIDFNGSGSETIPAFNYNNLTSSSSGARTLASSGTIGVAGTFTPGTNSYTITGSTVDFNGTSAQGVPGFNYNNLTISGNKSGGAVTFANGGTVGVAGTFSPIATNNTYVTTGNIVNFNGGALQTIPAFSFGGLTLSNAAGANLSADVTVNGALLLAAGALGVGTNTLTLNGSASFGAGTLTSAATGTVNYNQQSNGQATVLAGTYGNLTFSNFNKTLAAGMINIAGTFTPGTATGHTVTGNTINFNGSGAQSIPGFTYNNLTVTGSGRAITLDSVNTIKIAGVFTPNANNFTITGSTIEYNGTSAQTLPSTNFNTYNNLTLNNAAGVTGFAGLTVNGLLRVAAGTFTSSSTYNNVQIDASGTLAGTNATTINMTGNWTNNGTFTPNGNTVSFNGAALQTIGGSATTAFNNLTINNANGVTMSGNVTVNGTLALTAGALGIGTNTLTLNGGTTVGSGSFTSGATGTVNYNQGSNGQGVLAGNYGNLTFSNFNKTLPAGTVGIAGTFTPGSGSHTVTGNTIVFNGSALQSIPAFTFNDLTLNNAAGANLTGAVTVNGTLTLTSGVLGVGTNTLTLNNGTSVGSGSFTSGATGTVNYAQSSNGQSILAGNYGNLTFSNFNKTLPAATIGIAGTFTPGTATGHTVTGNTINFNGSSAQTIPAFNYNNLTSSSSGARTLGSPGAIGIAGIFTPGSNTYTVTGSTVAFNGSALQSIPAFTFNGLTLNNAAGANLGGAVIVGGTLTLTSGALGVGTNTLTLNSGTSVTSGTLTSGATGTVIYNQNSNGQAVLAANYGNLTFSNFAKTLPNAGTVGIAGTFTPGSGAGHTVTGSTVDFNGSGAQNIPAFTFNNLTTSTGGTKTTTGNIGVNGNATVGTGTTLVVSTGNTLTVTGTLTNNGTIMGLGTIVNNFSNGGQLSPGLSPGILNITGTYANPGTLNIEIGGTGGAGVNPNGHDELLISGAATLSGTLNVTLTNGYTGATAGNVGNTFVILDAASLSGTFSTVNLPSISPNTWQTTYDPAAGTVTLKVAAAAPTAVADGPNVFAKAGGPHRTLGVPADCCNLTPQDLRLDVSNANEDRPRTAALDNDSFVMVWTQSTGNRNILAQRFRPNGDTNGSVIAVTPSDATIESQPDVTAIPGGGFAVIWVQSGSGTSDLKVNFYNSAGSQVGSTLTLSNAGTVAEINPTISFLGGVGSNLVATWDVAGASDTDIYGQRFLANGTLVDANPVLLAGTADNFHANDNPTPHAVAGLGDGTFAMTWVEGLNVKVQTFNTSMSGGTITTLDKGTLNDRTPDVALLASGKFLVAWEANTSGPSNPSEIWGQRFTSAGATDGAAFELTGGAIFAGSETEPSISGLPDGGFALSWLMNSSFGANNFDVHFWGFDADGTPRGPILVNGSGYLNTRVTFTDNESGPGPEISENDLVATALADGRVLTSWIDPHTQRASKDDVLYQVWDMGTGKPLTVSTTASQIVLPSTFVPFDNTESLDLVIIQGGLTDFGASLAVGHEGDCTYAGDYLSCEWVIQRGFDAAETALLNQLQAGTGNVVIDISPNPGPFSIGIAAITSDSGASPSTRISVPRTINIEFVDVANPNLTVNDVTKDEGNTGTTTFTFTVNLSGPAPAGGVTFDIATADGTAQDDTPATEDNDYVAKSLTSQTIPEGSTSYTFDVAVNGDTVPETNETFFVNVTNVTGATVTDGQGQGTITNDDAPAADTAPTVSSTTPTNGATGVSVSGNITVDFSEAVTASTSSFTIECPAPGNLQSFAVSGSGTSSIVLDPTANLPASTTCTVTVIANQISDTDANDPPDNMAANYVFSFTTAGPADTAPTVSSTTPTNGATGISASGNITVNFSEAVTASTSSFTIECPAPGNLQAFAVTGSGTSSIVLDPTANLPTSTTCTVTVIANQISDVDANDPPDNMAANYVFSFTTAATATAADVSVSGRVLDANGNALRSVRITLDDGTGHPMTAITNSLGYYRFESVRSGSAYVVNATARGYTFTPRVVSVKDSIFDLDITALP